MNAQSMPALLAQLPCSQLIEHATPATSSGSRGALARRSWLETTVVAIAVAIIASWMLLPSSVLGLDPNRRLTQYLHEAWGDALPHATVQDVLQSHDGYLWIATQEGLARFDGIRFTVFTPQNTPLLGNGDVVALHENPAGTLWIATRGNGVVTYSEGRFTAIQGLDEGPAKVVLSITHDRSDRMWFATLGGLISYQENQSRRYGVAEGLPTEAVRAVREDRHGTLWVATRETGLSRLEDDHFSPWRPAGIPAQEAATLDVVCLLASTDGTLWIGTRSHGLLRVHEDDVTVVAAPGDLHDAAVVDLLEDGHGNVWVATYGGGLGRYSGDRIAWITTADGLTSDIVIALFEDRESSLWIGTAGGGLNRLRDGTVTTFTTQEGLSSNHVYCVLEDSHGSLWIGTEGGGLNQIQGDQVAIWTTEQGLSSNNVTALLEDRRGTLWIGTRDRGINRFEEGHFTVLGRADGLSSTSIFSMIEDPEGRIWVGTIRGGLSVIEEGRARAYGGDDPALTAGSIFALGLDPNGRLLVGTDGAGLKIIDREKVTTWSSEQGLSNDTVVSLHAEADGTIWAGTYGGGLNRIREGRIETISTANGLWNDRVFSILDDGRGRFWMTCNQGVFSLEKQSLAAFFAGTVANVTPTAFGRADGMHSSECAAGTHPASWRGRNGVLWLATDGGVVRLDPNELHGNPIPPPVRIENITADGIELETGGSPRLDSGTERLEVRYTALSLMVPEKVTFRYRLEGFDRDWIDAGTSRTTTFTNLPTGRRYRFVVTAANSDGIWNEEGDGFSFEIAPHFYERPTFLVLAGLALLLAGRGGYRLRLRHLLRRTQALEDTVAERTAEVVEEKERVEAANRELAKLNQVKSEFLAIAAHDLKNPLTVIHGYADLMTRGTGRTDHDVGSRARAIGASVNQMLNTIDDLLDTTAIESGKLRLETQPADLGFVTSEVVARNSVRAQEREIALTFELDPETLYPARVDPARVARVFDNLISNAIKFSDDGGTVTVGLGRLARDSGSFIRFSVRDHGPGLSAADQRKLFRRFERLSARPAGGERSSGLGLSIVKQFVDLHDGKVWVTSSLGEGATFFVDLPAISEDELEEYEQRDR